MSLRLEKAHAFLEDFTLQAVWYVRKAGGEVAAASSRRWIQGCAGRDRPDLGRVRRFKHPKLQGLRSFALERPFQRFLIFYREDGLTLQAVRLMDGARDLPRQLAEPPGPQ